MEKYRHIEQLLKKYFHSMRQILQVEQASLKAKEEELAHLTALLQSDMMIPSRGTAVYDRPFVEGGEPGDSTASAVAGYESTVAYVNKQINTVTVKIAKAISVVSDLSDTIARLDLALSLLSDDHRTFIIERYDKGYGLVYMRNQHGYKDDRTVRHYLNNALEAIEDSLNNYEQLKDIPVQQHAETMPKTCRNSAEKQGELALSC